MITESDELYSVGDLAEKAGCQQHQVQYWLRSRHVQPVRRIRGRFRMFGPETLAELIEYVQNGKKIIAEAV